MRLTWARIGKSPQAPVSRLHFVMWDFLKMFTAAVACGLAFSILAASVAIVLSRDAEAAAPANPATAAPAGPPLATAGVLLAGDGCGAITVDAVERDWFVTIQDGRIDVRVMQTFVIPAESDAGAGFYVQLPPFARLLALTAQTATTDWNGRLMPLDAYESLPAERYLALTRRHLLVARSPAGMIATSPIIDAAPGSVVTITYTYSIDGQNLRTLDLPLGAGDDADTDAPSQTTGNVWVQWKGSLPARIDGLPQDADIETSRQRIEGFSWAATGLGRGARLNFSWSL